MVGYILAFPLSALAILIPTLERSLTSTTNYFTGALSFLMTVLVGTLWGAGPAFLTILLGILGLDYFVVPPTNQIDFFGWPDILFFGPFLFAQLAVLSVIIMREKDRRRILLAEKEALRHAQAVSEVNQALEEGNEKLVEADRLKDQFLSQASHELKTPIAMIHGWAQYALRPSRKLNKANLDTAPYLEKIEELTDQLASLVDDLLDISSLMGGQLPLRLAQMDLVTLCKQVVEEQRLLSRRRFDEKYPATPLLLQADKARLTQVVNNLVTNAIKYSLAESTIQVEVDQQPESALLHVHNDGPAIPQTQQDDLFEPFYRAPDARASSKEGWGLGLSISKQIIERHQGHIWVESFEGQGTTFYVELPLAHCFAQTA
ncbi:sensor histidine kinase [Dictyobacter kobayashii]|uniref:histidine kinase n=1 Tax=Dictyobacter kobayashii TaxID=2014872 RepID=A0A402AI33_9CHLR|nr:HAMP domain-containing sensor histidine kinase [Dictyobacter kobayashii]GCE18715.1 hypothetical protein KDK_25150 [Dictyobacter kobayashii]